MPIVRDADPHLADAWNLPMVPVLSPDVDSIDDHFVITMPEYNESVMISDSEMNHRDLGDFKERDSIDTLGANPFQTRR